MGRKLVSDGAITVADDLAALFLRSLSAYFQQMGLSPLWMLTWLRLSRSESVRDATITVWMLTWLQFSRRETVGEVAITVADVDLAVLFLRKSPADGAITIVDVDLTALISER